MKTVGDLIKELSKYNKNTTIVSYNSNADVSGYYSDIFIKKDTMKKISKSYLNYVGKAITEELYTPCHNTDIDSIDVIII